MQYVWHDIRMRINKISAVVERIAKSPLTNHCWLVFTYDISTTISKHGHPTDRSLLATQTSISFSGIRRPKSPTCACLTITTGLSKLSAKFPRFRAAGLVDLTVCVQPKLATTASCLLETPFWQRKSFIPPFVQGFSSISFSHPEGVRFYRT